MSMIISVHSFRGGTGKSNITANVATQLALRGKRVGVIDTDIQSPGIYVHFRMDEGKVDKALNDYLLGHCSIEETAYDVSAQVGMEESGAVGGRVYLIPSLLRAGQIVRILQQGYEIGILNEGYQVLIDKMNLAYLFVDTPPGLNGETFLSIATSDLLFVILRPDQKDFLGTAVTVDVARKLVIPRIFLIVNKALSCHDFADLRRQVEETYGCPVAAVLPLSEDVARTASVGVFSLHYPDHPFSQGISEIVACVEALD